MRNGGMDMIDQFGIVLFLRFNSRFIQALFLSFFGFLKLLVYGFMMGLLSGFFIKRMGRIDKNRLFSNKNNWKNIFLFFCM